MPGDVRLIVQGDDFGMCHAVNAGTVQAFREGILTQASTMAACPWFTEAAALARRFGIPLGAHQTLTCEWDHLRWRPLTGGPSLVSDDGTFFRTVADARASLTHDDAVRELSTQVARFAAEGLAIDYLDVHMGESAPTAYAEISSAAGKPYIYGPEESQRFASIEILSDREADTKKPWVLGYLAGLTPGVHLLGHALRRPRAGAGSAARTRHGDLPVGRGVPAVRPGRRDRLRDPQGDRGARHPARVDTRRLHRLRTAPVFRSAGQVPGRHGHEPTEPGPPG